MMGCTRSRDKLRSLQLLARRGISLPVTGFAHSLDDVEDMMRMVGGAPAVIKLLEGTQGIGVVLTETKQAAESVIEAFMGLKANILIQEFIKEAGGVDILRSNHGPVVMEVNSSPGLEGIEQATGKM